MAASFALTSPGCQRRWLWSRGGSGATRGGRSSFSDIDRANDLALTRWLIIYATWEDLVRRPGKILSQLEDALA